MIFVESSVLMMFLLGALLFKNKTMKWSCELGLLIIITFILTKVNVYIAVSVFLFHTVGLISLQRITNFLGTRDVKRSVWDWIQSFLVLCAILMGAVVKVSTEEISYGDTLEKITMSELVDSITTQTLPYLFSLCLIGALLLVSLSFDRGDRR